MAAPQPLQSSPKHQQTPSRPSKREVAIRKFNKLVGQGRVLQKNKDRLGALKKYLAASQIGVKDPKLDERIEILREKCLRRSLHESEDALVVYDEPFNLNIVTNDVELHLKHDSGDGEDDEDVQTPIYEITRSVFDALYDYQRDCLSWFWKLHLEGTGGILGDDMGMGKTIQVAGFLHGLFNGQIIESVLLVADVSLIQNWKRELERWCPDVPIEVYHNKTTAKMRNCLQRHGATGGVLLTSYGMVKNRVEQLDEVHEDGFDYFILDEGHKIKNPSNKISKAVRVIRVNGGHRIILSGTPLQNNLQELWALFDFTSKGELLGDRKTFKTEFEDRIKRANEKCATDQQKARGTALAAELERMIRPYFLRRKKEDFLIVKKSDKLKEELEAENDENADPNSRGANSAGANENDGGGAGRSGKNEAKDGNKKKKQRKRGKIDCEKTDFIVWTIMNDVQIKLYRQFLAGTDVSNLLKNTSRSPLAALTMLKKICDSPRLLNKHMGMCDHLDFSDVHKDDTLETIVGVSTKVGVSYKLLRHLSKGGYKTLFFSQSKVILNIMEELVEPHGISHLRLDGSVKPELRQRIVDKFNKDDPRRVDVLFLTTQVGGLGLNLVGAQRVIIFDPAWNPAKDSQAVDRAYRLGQTEDVVIFRLMTCGTIEEKIYRRQISKIGLFDVVTNTKSEAIGRFTRKELHDVFTLEDTESSMTYNTSKERDARVPRSEVVREHMKFFDALSSKVVGLSDHDLITKAQTIKVKEKGAAPNSNALSQPLPLREQNRAGADVDMSLAVQTATERLKRSRHGRGMENDLEEQIRAAEKKVQREEEALERGGVHPVMAKASKYPGIEDPAAFLQRQRNALPEHVRVKVERGIPAEQKAIDDANLAASFAQLGLDESPAKGAERPERRDMPSGFSRSPEHRDMPSAFSQSPEQRDMPSAFSRSPEHRDMPSAFSRTPGEPQGRSSPIGSGNVLDREQRPPTAVEDLMPPLERPEERPPGDGRGRAPSFTEKAVAQVANLFANVVRAVGGGGGGGVASQSASNAVEFPPPNPNLAERSFLEDNQQDVANMSFIDDDKAVAGNDEAESVVGNDEAAPGSDGSESFEVVANGEDDVLLPMSQGGIKRRRFLLDGDDEDESDDGSENKRRKSGNGVVRRVSERFSVGGDSHSIPSAFDMSTSEDAVPSAFDRSIDEPRDRRKSAARDASVAAKEDGDEAAEETDEEPQPSKEDRRKSEAARDRRRSRSVRFSLAGDNVAVPSAFDMSIEDVLPGRSAEDDGVSEDRKEDEAYRRDSFVPGAGDNVAVPSAFDMSIEDFLPGSAENGAFRRDGFAPGARVEKSPQPQPQPGASALDRSDVFESPDEAAMHRASFVPGQAPLEELPEPKRESFAPGAGARLNIPPQQQKRASLAQLNRSGNFDTAEEAAMRRASFIPGRASIGRAPRAAFNVSMTYLEDEELDQPGSQPNSFFAGDDSGDEEDRPLLNLEEAGAGDESDEDEDDEDEPGAAFEKPNYENVPILEAAMKPVPLPSLDDSFFLADGSRKPSVAKAAAPIPRTPLRRKASVEEEKRTHPPTPAQRNVDAAFMNLSSSDAWAPSPQPAPKIDLKAYKKRRQSMGRRGPRYSNIFSSVNPSSAKKAAAARRRTLAPDNGKKAAAARRRTMVADPSKSRRRSRKSVAPLPADFAVPYAPEEEEAENKVPEPNSPQNNAHKDFPAFDSPPESDRNVPLQPRERDSILLSHKKANRRDTVDALFDDPSSHDFAPMTDTPARKVGAADEKKQEDPANEPMSDDFVPSTPLSPSRRENDRQSLASQSQQLRRRSPPPAELFRSPPTPGSAKLTPQTRDPDVSRWSPSQMASSDSEASRFSPDVRRHTARAYRSVELLCERESRGRSSISDVLASGGGRGQVRRVVRLCQDGRRLLTYMSHRNGQSGDSQVVMMASEKACAAELAIRVEEKLAKGYRLVAETDVRPPDSDVAPRSRRSLGRPQADLSISKKLEFSPQPPRKPESSLSASFIAGGMANLMQNAANDSGDMRSLGNRNASDFEDHPASLFDRSAEEEDEDEDELQSGDNDAFGNDDEDASNGDDEDEDEEDLDRDLSDGFIVNDGEDDEDADALFGDDEDADAHAKDKEDEEEDANGHDEDEDEDADGHAEDEDEDAHGHAEDDVEADPRPPMKTPVAGTAACPEHYRIGSMRCECFLSPAELRQYHGYLRFGYAQLKSNHNLGGLRAYCEAVLICDDSPAVWKYLKKHAAATKDMMEKIQRERERLSTD